MGSSWPGVSLTEDIPDDFFLSGWKSGVGTFPRAGVATAQRKIGPSFSLSLFFLSFLLLIRDNKSTFSCTKKILYLLKESVLYRGDGIIARLTILVKEVFLKRLVN